MLPLDTYIRNRKNYAIQMKGDERVFAYPRVLADRNTACTRKWWNIQSFYRRTYRELSYDFKHNRPDLR